MGMQSAPLRLARDELGDTRHICALFDGVDEANAVLQPFMAEGLDQGDQVIHVVEDRVRSSDRLGERTNVAAAVESCQLVIKEWNLAYLLDRRFNAAWIKAPLPLFLLAGSSLVYRGVQLIGDITWV